MSYKKNENTEVRFYQYSKDLLTEKERNCLPFFLSLAVVSVYLFYRLFLVLVQFSVTNVSVKEAKPAVMATRMLGRQTCITPLSVPSLLGTKSSCMNGT